MAEQPKMAKAKCGKMVPAARLQQHERLCSACGGTSPLAALNARKRAEREAKMAEEMAHRGPPPDSARDTPPPSKSPPQSAEPVPAPPPPPEDGVATKAAEMAVAALVPAFGQRFDEFGAQIAELAANITPEKVKGMIDQTLQEMMKKAQEQPASGDGAGSVQGTPAPASLETIRPPNKTEEGLLTFLGNLLKPSPSTGLDQMRQMAVMMNDAAQAQIAIFRAGSDFASNLISAASRLGAPPGQAADLLRQKEALILERHPNL